jgi:hypothetical protein
MDKHFMKILYGSSPMLYGGTSYGSKVEGAPSLVRQFNVIDETSRSFVLQNGKKVSKKNMVLDVGAFAINMFLTVGEAVESLRVKRS